MDRNYIESEHIVDRYLSGDLTVREAREFEKYCLDHPDVLKSMPIPVRLKARLSRRPVSTSETGVFQALMQVCLVNDGPVTLICDSPPPING